MTRPDVERLRRNAATVFSGNGETATLRTYVSASAGAPQFGVAHGLTYNERIITAMFASNIFGAPRPNERAWPAGLTQNAELMMTTEWPVDARDEVVWRGTAYRVAGAAMPETIGGRVMYRNPLRLAAQTG